MRSTRLKYIRSLKNGDVVIIDPIMTQKFDRVPSKSAQFTDGKAEVVPFWQEYGSVIWKR